jgi:hypothetical protein
MKKLSSSGKFSTVSITPEEGKLHKEAKWGRNILMDTNHVQGVFLDHDCAINKNMFTLVSLRRLLLCKVGLELFKCTGFAPIAFFS